jgi:hypothetical protein
MITAMTAQTTPAASNAHVAYGLQDVAQDHTDYESNPDGNRKRDGQSSHINRGHQQEIGQIENRSSDHCGNDI